MILGFKTQIKVKKSQRELLAKHAGTARHAYNWGLALCKQILNHNQINLDTKIKFPTAIDLHKWLVALVKPENIWYYEVSKCALQYALKALSDAFKGFWNKKHGFPRFKKKTKSNDSFTLDSSITVEHNKIKVPIIGWLSTYEQLPYGIKPRSVTISRQADKWFISFKIEVDNQDTPKLIDADSFGTESSAPKSLAVGIDLGLLQFATFSTTEFVASPRPCKALEKKLALWQWRNRNKQLHSNNWRKAQVKIARLHACINNIRKDFIHKLTSRLAKKHSKIVLENLNVRGMLQFKKLSKAISDSGFYEFKRQLEYKTLLYGSELVLADRWFPSSKTCFSCGQVKDKLPLSVRTFECKCGWCREFRDRGLCPEISRCDRDLNASYNLVRQVLPDFMPVDKKEPTPLVEAGSCC